MNIKPSTQPNPTIQTQSSVGANPCVRPVAIQTPIWAIGENIFQAMIIHGVTWAGQTRGSVPTKTERVSRFICTA